ncbi:tetratricopeptide repeat protein [Halotia branconii]|uniref:Tetratricopeptide repeat protein n=1 Tax=Halotia branconii CENA392 TaxID=1539056 RepID=A0AAJ6NPP0_9CYAN|nr:tetratricopeptide repeat protein [Halotia branconii]WGV24433.1 tetratricopeptide repeat protein [Halotia branconii CENA392]
MQQQHQTLIQPLITTGQVIILEAESGRSRRQVLQQWLQDAQNHGASTWLLTCDFEEDGVWAGLKDLIAGLLPQIQQQAPELIIKHSYELTIILPALRRQISVQNAALTDTAIFQEKVRNYPIDRAYRIVHGLINLLDAWYKYTDGSPWVIACDRFHRAGTLVRMFFTELIRRRGQQLNLTLLIAIDPGCQQTTTSQFDAKVVKQFVCLDLQPEPEASVSPQEMTKLAQKLEQQVGSDLLEIEIHLPQLIRYWQLAERPDKAVLWQARALGIYNHHGFYHEALVYAQVVSDHLESLCGQDEERRWNLVGNIFGCNTAAGNVTQAQKVVEQEALAKIKDPRQRVRIYYVMAMLYARYLPNRDLTKAAEYLETALADLPGLDLPDKDKYFLTSFTLNGLALVRHRQGKSLQAIELCRQAIKLLNTYLHPDQHRLHRSVLLYNIAQVLAVTGPYQEAIAQFTDAIAMDPNYSEYYNERGNVYLKMGDLDKALKDYLKAIELSPPYQEVWTNLGLCYRQRGQMVEAVQAYSVAFDLNPYTVPSLIGRAEALEVLEQPEAALVDYNTAIALNPNQPMFFANRARLYYEIGRLPEALADLNQAIALSQDDAELYQNRAVALIALGYFENAVDDLQTYLRLNPNAQDRTQIEGQLASLLDFSKV